MGDHNVHRFKIVILGDTGVGKTSLAVRFVRDVFRKFENTTGGGYLCSFIVYLVAIDSLYAHTFHILTRYLRNQ